MFLPHVQSIIDEANKKKTIFEKIDYLFKQLPNICIKPADELTVKELAEWADFFGLSIKLKTTIKRRRK